MKRVGALVGAVVMVVAALAVRGTFGDDAEGNGAETSGRLVCPAEFRTICQRAGGATVESAGDTADALVGDEAPSTFDDAVWIVPEAWARLVIAERARLGLGADYEVVGPPLASSPTVLAVWDDRADQLTTICGRPVDWTCLAEEDGTTLADGDRVRTGASPVDSAIGLSVAAAQAADLLDTTDYAFNDFTGSFNSLASRLASGQRDDPVGTMRTQGPGRLTAVGTVGADATDLATNFGTIRPVADIEPPVRVDVVALTRAGGSLDDGTRRVLEDALLEDGWSAPADGPTGLPGGSVLAALRTFWNENR